MRATKTTLAMLLLCGGAVACSDQAVTPISVEKPAGTPSAMIMQDPAIDQSDTYITMDEQVSSSTTVQLTDAVYDAATGAPTSTLSFSAPTESRSVEAGYDVYDQVHVNTYRAPDGLSTETAVANEVRTIRAVNNSYTQYDANGAAVASTTPDGAVGTSPLSVLGNMSGVSITNGVLVDDASADPSTPRPTLKIPAGGKLEFPAAGVMRVTTDLFGPGAGAPHMAASAQGQAKGKGTLIRQYHKQSGKWVLDQVQMVTEAETPEATFTSTQTTVISNVRWHENRAKDAHRRKGQEPVGPRDAYATPSGFEVRPMIACPYSTYSKTAPGGGPRMLCADPGDGGGGGYTPPPPPPPTGSNVVFQHGIFSNSGTWSRMDPWLSNQFYFNTKLLPSLNSTDRLYNQATALIGTMAGTGQSGFILVGHSQGGLISRSAAQRRTDLVRGVVTIGTPHQGALLARNGRVALANFLNGQFNRLAFGCYSPYQDAGCYIAYFLGQYALNQVLQYAIDAAVPAQIDLQPGNAFAAGLNSTPEYFTRVGIESYANKRFVLARLGGDAFCNPEAACGGRAWASYAQWAYNGFVSCTVIAGILGYWNTAYWCHYIYGRMDDIDRGWDQLTAPGQTSDGIVQGPSQVYPNASRQYPISSGDSHVGETKSDKTRDRLVSTLTSDFAVPRKY